MPRVDFLLLRDQSVRIFHECQRSQATVRWAVLRRLWLSLSVLLVSHVVTTAASTTTFSHQQLEFFEKQVRPLLAEHCYSCHSVGAEKLKAGLLLDSRDALLAGGDSGPAIEPGNADASLLIEAVRYESFEMPPRGKLSADQVAVLEQWINDGAAWPAQAAPAPSHQPTASTFDLTARRQEHWCWQPVKRAQPPTVDPQPDDWPRNEVDQFILHRLQQAGIPRTTPAAPAHTQLRRLCFDLIGLPPTLEQIQSFGSAPTGADYEAMVDELLASPHFGEKWARHWLDLVRYAETYGHEFDYANLHVHRYRDYLIRAFNDDLPYDQFIVEQIAGDLLDSPRTNPSTSDNESLLATAFWWLGEAVHAPTKVREDEADRIDNQIDVMSKTFLGLTIGCARCHDHKFDALSTEDYYALAGYLMSSRRKVIPSNPIADLDGWEQAALQRSERINSAIAGMEIDRQPWQTALLAAAELPADLPEKDDAQTRAKHEAISAVAGKHGISHETVRRWYSALHASGTKRPDHPLFSARRLLWNSSHRMAEQSKLKTELAQAETQYRESIAKSVAFEGLPDAVHKPNNNSQLVSRPGQSLQWFHDGSRFLLARENAIHSGLISHKLHNSLSTGDFNLSHGKIHVRMRATKSELRSSTHGYWMDQYNPLLFGHMRHKSLNTNGDFQWITLAGALRHYIGERVYVEWNDLGDGFFEVDQVRLSDADRMVDAPSDFAQQIAQDDALTDQRTLIDAIVKRLAQAVDEWPAENASPELTEDDRRLVEWLVSHQLVDVSDANPAGSSPQSELATYEAAYHPRHAVVIHDGTPWDSPLYIRGNSDNVGEPVPRRFYEALGSFAAPADSSGRLELARQIASADNPLTTRVIVNRLWHHLFGQGIVPSTDDFGVMGQPPSHPALLDWLANDLVEHDWSLKHTIKTLVMSATYRMSSRPDLADAGAAEADPSNRLLHRMRFRRLPAESIRDAVLMTSGNLQPKMFGRSVPVHLTEFDKGRGRPGNNGPLDGDGRRSIYLTVRRNFLPAMLMAYDFPSPGGTRGRRTVSNVPAQSLILMNSPFIVEQAGRWAESCLATEGNDREKIERLFKLALSHPPNGQQLAAAEAFLVDRGGASDDQAARQSAWQDLCHMLWNMKEFIYLN